MEPAIKPAIQVLPITELQQSMVERWHQVDVDNAYADDPWLETICQQHQYNFLLWHQEDIARSPQVSDQEIAQVKRAIDRLNQQRNDWIEKIDDLITKQLEELNLAAAPEAPINTETPGSVIDRLSILSLRIYHLQEQLDRDDVDPSHLASVRSKIAICLLQKDELSEALQQLLNDIFVGTKRHRTYRQLKMYNDPNLNPYLYRLKDREKPVDRCGQSISNS